MFKHKLVIAVLLLLLVLGVLAVWYARRGLEDERTVETIGKEEQWMETAFEEHLKSVTEGKGNVHFVSDGFFVADSGQAASANFVVGVRGVFRTEVDHHAAIVFQIESIEPDGVVVGYESRFDHRSFGKDLVTIDRGRMKLAWRGGKKRVP